MRRTGAVTSLMTLAVLAGTPLWLGAKGCVFGGVVGLGDNGDGSGGVAVFATGDLAAGGNGTGAGGVAVFGAGGGYPTAFTSGGSAVGGNRTGGGSPGVLPASGGLAALTGGRAPGAGGAPSSAGGSPSAVDGLPSGAGGSTSASSGPLPMDASCWVPADSNSFGIQGPWFTFSDQDTGGKTVIVSPPGGGCPYVAGQGMCLHATSPGGGADNWLTWGAGISLNLNQVGADAVPLSPAPRCLTVVLSVGSAAPAGFTAEITPLAPADTIGKLVPGKFIQPGSNEVCVDNVTKHFTCDQSSDRCVDPALLADGVGAIGIVAHIGSDSGSLDFCIESITPHD